MDWPNHFPENCPPNAAKDADGEEVYRLVDQNPPSDPDFISHRLRYPKREFFDECKACGLSIFTNIEDSIKLRKRLPALRDTSIALGKLPSEAGKILPTPYSGNSHYTWWIPNGVKVAGYFKVIIN
jgi:hypothetical protein